MKSIFKLILVVSLFSSVAFADGDMGSGGKTCTSNCLAAIPQPTEKDSALTQPDDSTLTAIQEYLNSIFKYFEN